jgi:hypothetical protein
MPRWKFIFGQHPARTKRRYRIVELPRVAGDKQNAFGGGGQQKQSYWLQDHISRETH